jgi:hypothetical protein
MPGWNSPISTRTRIAYKTRFQVLHGGFDGDWLLQEDEEKARAISTEGVDIEDANVGFFFGVGM